MSNNEMLVEYLKQLELSPDIKEEVENLFERAKKIPDLRIIETRLPVNTIFKGTFKEEDLEVSAGTVKDNFIEMKIHNDRWYLPDNYVSTKGTKLMTYRPIREPLGLITLEMTAGNQSRNQDYRRERLEKPFREIFNFVCIEGKNPYYVQYKDLFRVSEDELTDNQKIAVERLKESEYVVDLLQPYILRYVLCIRNPILNLPTDPRSPFKYSSGDHANKFWGRMKELVKFVDESKFYLKCMLILNQLDIAEYNELEICLDRATSYLSNARRTLQDKYERCKVSKKEELYFTIGTNRDDFDSKLTGKNLKFYNRGKGPVQTAFDYVDWLLKERNERLQDVAKLTGEEIMNGYVHIDNEGRLYPNLYEIERRKDLYKNYGDSSMEQEIQHSIRKKKGKGSDRK